MSEKKRKYIVELVRPKGCTDTDICYMIEGAVKMGPGYYPECNPLFNLDPCTVKVKSFLKVAAALNRRKP